MPFRHILYSVKNSISGVTFVTLFIFFVFFLANAHENLSTTTALSIEFIFPAFISIQQIQHLIMQDQAHGILESEIANGKRISFFILQKTASHFICILLPIALIAGCFIYLKIPSIDFFASFLTLCFFLLSLAIFSSIGALLKMQSFLIYILCAPLQIPLILWALNTLSLGYCFIPIVITVSYFLFMLSFLFLCEDILKEYTFTYDL
jgi:ABC-type transport system involved in cytochrome c biogenesis permease component